MPAGRPSSYRPEYCKQLIEHMSEGYSFESFAGKIGTTFKTMYMWAENYPDFQQAKDEGFAKNRVFWEKVGIDGATGRVQNFNAVSWVFNMKNRFNWRDNRDTVVEVSGINGGPVQIVNLSPEERRKRLQIAQEKMKHLIEAVVVNETEEES